MVCKFFGKNKVDLWEGRGFSTKVCFDDKVVLIPKNLIPSPTLVDHGITLD
jgi:hypothetical protein